MFILCFNFSVFRVFRGQNFFYCLVKNSILQFSNVSVDYVNGFRAVQNVSFALEKGECLAIVGESGSGKTTLVRAALGILPRNAKVSGSIKIGETEIVGASEKTLRNVRGIVAGFVAQEPFSAFNPLANVFDHISEAWRVHSLKPNSQEVFDSLEKLGIENAAQISRKYPFEWSGGMLQRAVIAASSAHAPEIIIADEPTSALDADRADSILTALRETKSALLLISHDINLVRRYADKIAVCFNGEIVEIGETAQIFENPNHEYTKNLLSDVPRESEFENEKAKSEIVLEARDLSKIYGNDENKIHAVKRADLIVKGGEIVGICGTSGSGKSTLLRLLATIETPSSGEIFLENELATNGESAELFCKLARKGFVMPIFQDPLSSLNKNWKIWQIITEPLNAKHRTERFSKTEKREIARKILEEVGLRDVDLDTKPTRLSVGQCQRVSIARALTANPQLIVADEPTSALDVSVAQSIMKLLQNIAAKGTAIVIVSHNEKLLKAFCHRVLQMREGVLSD